MSTPGNGFDYTSSYGGSRAHQHHYASSSYYSNNAAGATAGGSSNGNGSSSSSSNGSSMAASPSEGLRRRNVSDIHKRGSPSSSSSSLSPSKRVAPSAVVKNLDFMFPKVDDEFTVQTDRGGMASLAALVLIALLSLAEISSWIAQNRDTTEHISVNTDLGGRMRVNLNITFPALACEDLHLDAMDVAGDSQIDVGGALVKRQLHLDGRVFSNEEISVETNAHRQAQEDKETLLKRELPPDYCGPCFGAQSTEDQCCQTCDEVIEAYKSKRWKSDLLLFTAEQCIREGRDKKEPKRMKGGEGCNLSGYMTVNRVAGNFHIAMGEGVERDGRHIHTFLPEDSPNFNASHTIHHLSFGPAAASDDNDDGASSSSSSSSSSPMDGLTKVVARDHGTTGLFQYFIKVVPTTFRGDETSSSSLFPSSSSSSSSSSPPEKKNTPPGGEGDGKEEGAGGGGGGGRDDGSSLETNRFFFTERFRPLMKEYIEEDHLDEEDPSQANVHAGHSGGHGHEDHHKVQNAVLPGVFFIYEIYPFAVEVSKATVPVTHLLIRLMATVGGVFTVVSWAESWYHRQSKRRTQGNHR